MIIFFYIPYVHPLHFIVQNVNIIFNWVYPLMNTDYRPDTVLDYEMLTESLIEIKIFNIFFK